MQAWTYPARIQHVVTDTEATYLVSFDDFAEALTEGETPQAAEAEAGDALATVVAAYLAKGLALPPPRAVGPGEVAITLEPAMAARAALTSIMAREHITKVALAARMGRDEKTVRQLLRPTGASLDLVLLALHAVGARPVLVV